MLKAFINKNNDILVFGAEVFMGALTAGFIFIYAVEKLI